MALYVIYRRNPYFPCNTYIESFDQGCQKAIVENEGNRLKIVRNEGLYIPFRTLRPFMLRVQKTGLDERRIS